MQIIVKDKVYELQVKSLIGTNYRRETLKEIQNNESDLAYAYAALYNDYRGKLDFTFEDLMFDITDEKAIEVSKFLKQRFAELANLFIPQEVEEGEGVPSQSGNSTSE